MERPLRQEAASIARSQGLVFIGMHSADRSENVDQFLKSKKISSKDCLRSEC